MMLLDQLTAIFAPHYCLGCGKEGLLLCSQCRFALKPHPMLCVHCHRISPGFKTCAGCRAEQNAQRIFVASLYEGTLRSVIGRFKYERAVGAARALTPLLEGVLPSEHWDTIVPVPSASKRYRQRGYNPAALLADTLGVNLHTPCHTLLGRLGQSRQVGAKRSERLSQLKGSFYVTGACQGMRILLVDDVVTTGATIHHCAQTLRRAGAKSVDAVVLARHVA
jgi:competence protein ComFC